MADATRFATPRQSIVVGPDLLAQELPAVIRELAASRLALVVSPSASRAGLAEAATRALPDGSVVRTIADVRPHAPIQDTERHAADLRVEGIDAVVAIGGGSVSDTAKAVAILLAEGGRMEDHCDVFTAPSTLVTPDLRRKKVPVIAVPTTLSAAEVTPGGGTTTAAGLKRVFWDHGVASRVVLYDTTVLGAVPPSLLLTTGMNAVAHCVEGLYSRRANPLSTGLAQEAIRLLVRGLLGIASEGAAPELALADAANGAALSGMVITNARVGLHHAICHVLGAKAGLPHGVANAIVLPHAMRYNADATGAAQERFRRAAIEGFVDSGIDRAQIEDRPPWWVAGELQRRLGVPRTLEQAGVGGQALAALATDVMQDRGLYFNPKVVSDVAEVEAVLRSAWRGLDEPVAAGEG